MIQKILIEGSCEFIMSIGHNIVEGSQTHDKKAAEFTQFVKEISFAVISDGNGPYSPEKYIKVRLTRDDIIQLYDNIVLEEQKQIVLSTDLFNSDLPF